MSKEAIFQIGIKALFLDSKRRILILRSGPAEMKHSRIEFWDLPGGRIQPGDDMATTLRRELREELGFGKADFRMDGLFGVCIAQMKRISKGENDPRLMLITYGCTILNRSKKIRLSDEHAEYRWASIRETKKLLSTKFPKSFLNNLDRQGKRGQG
jgi:8-oxo-dGTP pyrophosphatase MutT (NUDIX family)